MSRRFFAYRALFWEHWLQTPFTGMQKGGLPCEKQKNAQQRSSSRSPHPAAAAGTAARTRLPTPQLNAVSGARANFQVMEQGSLRPALHYTQQQATPSVQGWVESEETVHSKARSKQEFPQG